MSKESNKKVVNEIVKLFKEYPIVGLADVTNMPSPQLQKIRNTIKKSVLIRMFKKRMIKLAIAQSKENVKGLENLVSHLRGMPALLFTKESPFSLSKMLNKNKSNAPAKAGQLAPIDLIIHPGPTPFAPGPIIGEFGQAGLKTSVEGGKICIKEEKVVAKKGAVITDKVAGILAKLGIEPMEIKLSLVAAYENGTIYGENALNVDEEEFIRRIREAYNKAYLLSLSIGYPTKANINELLRRAYSSAQGIKSKVNLDSIKESAPAIEEFVIEKELVIEKIVEEVPKEIIHKEVHKEVKSEKVHKEIPVKHGSSFKKEEEVAMDVLKKLQDKKLDENKRRGKI